MTPLWLDFMRLGPLAGILLRFPGGSVEMSPALLSLLRLMPGSSPGSLEQWYELCHPSDHDRTRGLSRTLFQGRETSLTLERHLYCGDGVYRPFRLDACIQRDEGGAPLFLMGIETLLGGEAASRPIGGWRSGLMEAADRLSAEGKRIEALLRQAQDDASTQNDLALNALIESMPLPLSTLSPLDGRALNSRAFRRLAAIEPDLRARALALAEGERLECQDAFGRLRTFEVHFLSPEADGLQALLLTDVTDLLEAEAEGMALRRRLGRCLLGIPAEGASALHPAPLPAARGGEASDAADIRSGLNDRLAFALNAIARSGRRSSFASFEEQLRSLSRSLGETELTVGVVGLTGSGKSTFINALMGERLLPAETRATTNMTVLCRRGGTRSADIFYQDGKIERVTGEALTPQWMEEHTSEHWNPGNARGVSRIEWSSPDALIPSGLILADTPGLDACDLPRYGELILRRLLPGLDIVLYVTSIRTRFKAADVELMQTLLDGNQRIILLLSQIDLERDDMEAGRVVQTRRQKLERAVMELREDLQQASVPACPIIPISSRLALEGFRDRASGEWQGSNFDPLIRQLALFRGNILQYGTTMRGLRALSLLEQLLRRLTGEGRGQWLERRRAELRELRDAQRWMSAELSSVRNEWSRALSPDRLLPRFLEDIRSAASLGALRSHCLRWESAWADLIQRMTERMDRAREVCRQTLLRHEILPAALSDGSDSPSALSSMDRSLRSQEEGLRAQVRLEQLLAPFQESGIPLPVARDALAGRGARLLQERLELLRNHLNWWENHTRELFCDPLYAELKRGERSVAEVESEGAPDQAEGLEALRGSLADATAGIRQLLEGEQSALEPSEFSAPALPPAEEGESAQDVGLFTSLLYSMREQTLQTRFLALPALGHGRRLALLGLRRHDGLRLVSRLAHDSRLVEDSAEKLDAEGQNWLFFGEGTPPFPCLRVEDVQLPGGMAILSAPSDAVCASSADAPDWRALFADWTPVIHLDLARVDSGLSDLARAPWTGALVTAPRWVLAFAHGGLFDRKLPDLLIDVPERVAAFTELRDFRGTMDWFVYENYDARYTDFIGLAGQVSSRSDDDDLEALLSLWRERIQFDDAPFTEGGIRLALRETRDRLRRDVRRLDGAPPQETTEGA